MARREITQYFDDLDQTPLSEAELNAIEFSFNGTDYMIDLSSENLQKFHEVLTPYIAAAREVPLSTSGKIEAAAVRSWAQQEGLEVASRGKIPFEIVEAYRQAHS